MKNLGTLILLAAILPFVSDVQAQGTLYVSSLPPGRLRPFTFANVGNNSWVAEVIETGNDPGGYVLNSVQLFVDSEQNPGGFGVSIFAAANNAPSGDLENLTGSSNPAFGVYAYAASGLALSASTQYFVVVTVMSPGSDSTFLLPGDITSSTSGANQWVMGGLNLMSADQGSSWTSFGSGSQMDMAIYATAVPESPPLALLLFGGIALALKRR